MFVVVVLLYGLCVCMHLCVSRVMCWMGLHVSYGLRCAPNNVVFVPRVFFCVFVLSCFVYAVFRSASNWALQPPW